MVEETRVRKKQTKKGTKLKKLSVWCAGACDVYLKTYAYDV
jgi:NADH:ubiquinone oxidoreductase subunit E